jgi:hypothetical protein
MNTVRMSKAVRKYQQQVLDNNTYKHRLKGRRKIRKAALRALNYIRRQYDLTLT